VLKGKYDGIEDLILYTYTNDQGLALPINYDLGTEERSIIYMFESKMTPPIYERVLTEVAKKKEGLDSLEKLAAYVAVLTYYQEAIYPVGEKEAGGGAKVYFASLQHSVIVHEIASIKDSVSDLGIDLKDLRARSQELLQRIRSGKLPALIKKIVDNSNRLKVQI
jgi:hypothetical protein